MCIYVVVVFDTLNVNKTNQDSYEQARSKHTHGHEDEHSRKITLEWQLEGSLQLFRPLYEGVLQYTM